MYDLLQCIERALDKFGSNAKQATYWTMMTKEGISWNEVIANTETLMRVLAEIFGEDGSKLVEREMVKEIKKEFSLENHSRTYTISDALEIARKSLTGISENQIISNV